MPIDKIDLRTALHETTFAMQEWGLTGHVESERKYIVKMQRMLDLIEALPIPEVSL